MFPFIDIPGELFVKRGCALPGMKVGCKESWSTTGEVMRSEFMTNQCVCDTELCNSATNYGFNVFLGWIPALIVVQFTRNDL